MLHKGLNFTPSTIVASRRSDPTIGSDMGFYRWLGVRMVHESQTMVRRLGEGGSDCWRRPPGGMLKCNFDGVFVDSEHMGWGVIVLN